MELTAILDICRVPLEMAALLMLNKIMQRQAQIAVRVQHIEGKLGIVYPPGLV